MKKIFSKYIGDKKFYKMVFAIIIPIMIQQLLLNIAGYVDSIMINEYHYDPVTLIHEAYNGVSAANKLMFIFTFMFIGLSEGASIFIAQYYGANNPNKVKETTRLIIFVELLFSVLTFIFICFFGNYFVDLFIDSEAGRQYGYDYMNVIKYGVFVLAINTALASSFRSIEKPKLALYASMSGVFINVIFNYIFIFGNFGCKEMGSSGAALATVLSRVVELLFYIGIIIFTKNEFICGLYKKIKITGELLKKYIVKTIPLVGTELLFALGIVLFAKFYCYHNDTWYTSYTIVQNVNDLFFIIFAGLGNGTSVVIGATLGKSDFEQAKSDSKKLKFLGIIMGVSVGLLMIIAAPFITKMFKPSQEVYKIAVQVLIASGVFMAIYAYNSVCFFILRAGGDSVRAFLLDQLPTYCIGIPLAILFGVNAKNWGLSLLIMFLITHLGDIAKIFLSNYFVGKEKWVQNLTLSKKDI